MNRARRLGAEFLGTALLLASVVGSGVMGEQLAQGNDALALLANAGATAAMLYVLITALGPVSGAHLNPAITLVMWLERGIGRAEAVGFVLAQCGGAIAGVLLAHAMFGLDLVQPGSLARTGSAQWLSEAVATFGLALTILLGLRNAPRALPALVASYIFAAYWFTASTSFANPAVTLARALTRSFSGIRPEDVTGFVLAQLAGAVLAWFVAFALTRDASNAQRAASR